MRIGVLTSLYPSCVRPAEGIFAERRWALMRLRGHALRVVRPIPASPWYARGLAGLLRRPQWRELAAFPAGERRLGIEISYPRYAHVPGRALANARAFAEAGLKRLLGGHGGFAAAPPEVVVADYAWPAAAIAPLLADFGVPCLISGRGSDVLQVAGEPELSNELGRCLRAAGHWCAVSRDLLRRMDELGGAPGRGLLVPNGVDARLFCPRPRAQARGELGLEPGGALVLVVGHLIERKDPLLALEAFLAGAPVDARLVFIGSGPLARALESRVRSRGAAARVRLLGEQDPERLAVWYAACDLVLLTSTREGRPNVVLEALSCGRPVLCTPAGGTAELLEGLPECLSEEREPARIGERLGRLLAAPPAQERLRAAVAELTWEHGIAVLESLLAQASAQARSRA